MVRMREIQAGRSLPSSLKRKRSSFLISDKIFCYCCESSSSVIVNSIFHSFTNNKQKQQHKKVILQNIGNSGNQSSITPAVNSQSTRYSWYNQYGFDFKQFRYTKKPCKEILIEYILRLCDV